MIKRSMQDFPALRSKLGGIEWKKELGLITYLRNEGGPNMEIRLDANGAFEKEEFINKWSDLESLNIHSIEQPLAKGKDK